MHLVEAADAVVHAIVSLDVRARGRLHLVRATHPPDLDAEALAAWVDAALLAKGLGHVGVAWIPDEGPARVLSAAATERCRR
ncbi:MAG: hypothetical protein RLZZ383_1702 [Pseudomonadota bacterium]|jgi:hypothetical protein